MVPFDSYYPWRGWWVMLWMLMAMKLLAFLEIHHDSSKSQSMKLLVLPSTAASICSQQA